MKTPIVFALLGILFADYTFAAAIKSEEFAQQLEKIIREMHLDSRRIHRATESVEDRPKRNCYDTPCGWNTYDSVTRQATVFMPNTCRCPDDTYKCVRTGENVSMSAYVYHCRQNTTADDIEGEMFEDMEYLR
ncbi:hypothetical protein QLX08_010341 [Tetragonisca angustula]|uniref:Uncharacterized protein n=1 Tax=Tetragonisca angustula TaxID=166442 RepID=A0AAW0ZCJ6_9HYME